MDLLFCHDGPIERRDNQYYGIGFNDELFERYRVIADHISVAIRVHDNIDTKFDYKKYLKLSDNYKVVECPNVSSLKGQIKKNECFNILDNAIKSADLIIIRLPSFIGNIAVDICKKNKKIFFVELVGCPWDALWNHSFFGKLVAPYMYIKTKGNIKNAPFVQYVTNHFLQHRYPTIGKSIGCSDVKLLEKQVRKDYNSSKMSNKMIILGTIGVVDIKYKGQEYVIKAIQLLKKQGINVKYEMVGAGNTTRLKKIAQKNNVLDNISFLGPMKHDDIFEWLKNIDIYIQPSTTEGMPRSLIEAMSVGCLCIASDAGGMPELLQKDFIFKKKNYKQLYNIIMSLSNSDYEHQSIVNYNSSQLFNKDVLDKKRNDFLKEYKLEVTKNE